MKVVEVGSAVNLRCMVIASSLDTASTTIWAKNSFSLLTCGCGRAGVAGGVELVRAI